MHLIGNIFSRVKSSALSTTKKMVARLDLGWRAECQAELRPSIGSNGGHPYVHHEDENEQFRKIRLLTAILEKSVLVGTTICPEISGLMMTPSDWSRHHATPATHSLDAAADSALVPCCAGGWTPGS